MKGTSQWGSEKGLNLKITQQQKFAKEKKHLR